MLEIEQKFARVEFAELERCLAMWKARAAEPQIEADHYFNAPDRNFAQTGEAFRLRRVGEASWLTYKGPKRVAAVKIRTEIETPLAPGPAAAESMFQLLAALGYRPVRVVRKRRRAFHVDRYGFPLTVCLDEVDDLGNFAEVEIVAADERMAEAHEALNRVIEELGLDPRQVERRSYLTMLLQRSE